MTKEKLASYYHNAFAVLSVLTGIFLVFYFTIKDEGVTEGICLSILGIVGCTACFMIFPIACLAIGSIVKYAPIVAFPFYLITVIGYLCGDDNDIGFISFITSLLLSLFGAFNMYTRSIIKEEDKHDFLF